jgi:hypothetical protein
MGIVKSAVGIGIGACTGGTSVIGVGALGYAFVGAVASDEFYNTVHNSHIFFSYLIGGGEIVIGGLMTSGGVGAIGVPLMLAGVGTLIGSGMILPVLVDELHEFTHPHVATSGHASYHIDEY